MTAQATLQITVTAKDAVTKAFSTMTKGVKSFASQATGFFAGLFKTITSLRTLILGAFAKKAFQGITSLLEGDVGRSFQNAFASVRYEINGVLGDVANKLAPMVTEALKAFADWVHDNREDIVGFITSIVDGFKTLVSWIKEAISAIGNFGTAFAEAAENSYGSQMAERYRRQQTKNYRDMSPAEKDRFNYRARQISEVQALFAGQQGEVFDALDRTLRNARPPTERERVRSGMSAGTGIENYFRNLGARYSTEHSGVDEFGNPKRVTSATQVTNASREAAAAVGELVDSLENNLSSAIASMVKGTMKASDAIKEFGRAILDDFINQSVKQATKQLISGVAGAIFPTAAAANGAVFTGRSGGWMPVRGYATGGPIYDKPHVALIGEGRHKEAVIPMPDGKRVPVKLMGGGGTTYVTNNYIDAVDTQSFAAALTRSDRQTGVLRNHMLNAASTRRDVRNRFRVR